MKDGLSFYLLPNWNKYRQLKINQIKVTLNFILSGWMYGGTVRP